MPTTPYNLDDVQEHFEFKAGGHIYKFKHMTTEELQEFVNIKDDNDKSMDYILQFITKVDESAPDFKEVYKKFITPQIVKFQEMIKTEFGGNMV